MDAENPANWVIASYKQWVMDGRKPNNTPASGATTTTTTQVLQQQTSTQVQIQKDQDD